MASIDKVFVGVDVGLKNLDAHLHPLAIAKKFSNTNEGVEEFINLISKYSIGQIVCEPSGGYENLMVTILRDKGFPVWVVDGKRINSFIKSEGLLLKTDPADAQMIAKFAAEKKPKHAAIQSNPDQIEIKILMQRRLILIEMKEAETKRLNHPMKNLKDKIKGHIEFIENDIKDIDLQIQQFQKASQEIADKFKILKSIPGIGEVVANTLIAFVPELGSIENKQAAALIGVCPYERQSGSYRGKSIIKGGRSQPRKALYMAALSASHSNSIFKDYYRRLIEQKKLPKVALSALMNKLVITANAMLKNKTLWRNK